MVLQKQQPRQIQYLEELHHHLPLLLERQTVIHQSHNPGIHGANDPLGAFWNTEHAKNVVPDDKTRPRYDEELSSYNRRSSSRAVNPDVSPMPVNSRFRLPSSQRKVCKLGLF
ncbi:unnamed protein product [Cuscuta campestris]|uniref:Uncharacterized protein n=1 Tax=Cuscuta campestris TaxID=132261 RepID=A0A484NLU4_9ASTE|nr:unnamed protein product [Cuscuta campestris]